VRLSINSRLRDALQRPSAIELPQRFTTARAPSSSSSHASIRSSIVLSSTVRRDGIPAHGARARYGAAVAAREHDHVVTVRHQRAAERAADEAGAARDHDPLARCQWSGGVVLPLCGGRRLLRVGVHVGGPVQAARV
jgi:hypothetical protein